MSDGPDRPDPAFWLGVYHRASPGWSHLSPRNPPDGLTESMQKRWMKGWTDADQVYLDEGLVRLHNYGDRAWEYLRDADENLLSL